MSRSERLFTDEDEKHWSIVAAEVEGSTKRPGLWAKCYADTGGNEAAAKVAYMKLRVEQLQSDAEQAALAELKRSEQAAIAERNIAQLTDEKRAALAAKYRRQISELQYVDEKAVLTFINSIPLEDRAFVLSFKNDVGASLLHVASKEGWATAVELLCEGGADPSAIGPNGLLAPQIAVKNGHLELAKHLKRVMEAQGSSAAVSAPGVFSRPTPAVRAAALTEDRPSRPSDSAPPRPPTHSAIEPTLQPVGAWRRFFARFIDIWVIAVGLGFSTGALIAHLSPGWLQLPWVWVVGGFFLTGPVLIVEAIIFSVFGTTLGKALADIRVRDAQGRRPTGQQYFQRQWGVFWSGLGAGLPLIQLFAMGSQCQRIRTGRSASYDEGRFVVIGEKMDAFRTIAVTVFVVGYFGALGLMVSHAQTLGSTVVQGTQRGFHSDEPWVNPLTGFSANIPPHWAVFPYATDTHTIFVFRASGQPEGVGPQVILRLRSAALGAALDALAAEEQARWSGIQLRTESLKSFTLSGRSAISYRGLQSNPEGVFEKAIVLSDSRLWTVDSMWPSDATPLQFRELQQARDAVLGSLN